MAKRVDQDREDREERERREREVQRTGGRQDDDEPEIEEGEEPPAESVE